MSRESQDAITALRANAALYEAISSGDLRAMDAIWSREEPVVCIHPGGPPLRGRIAVMASWSEIFAGAAPPISYSQESVSLVRGVAFVNCLEHLGETTLAASNVLIWEAGAWRLVLHTAGVVGPSRTATPTPSTTPPERLH